MIRKKLKSKKGISLPVAMAITAVLVILSSALITIALTSIVSTSSSVNTRQAYLNVKSALEYASAYYGDSSNVPDLTKVDGEYMVMLDTKGGTTSEGAKITTKADTAGYTTYVKAKYLKASTDRDVPALKLTAFSKSSDAFGHREQNVQMSALYTLNKLSNKNRVTLTDLDMNTDVMTYDTVRDAISLHVKQYPGEAWEPFYYIWTYKDVSELYRDTMNCYGLESGYKNAASSTGDYVKKSTNATVSLCDGFNSNEYSDNSLQPAGVWNNPNNAPADKVGPTSTFTKAKNGWFDATYYVIKDTGDTYSDGGVMKQVNYFNMIIAKKGALLNSNYPNDEAKNKWQGNERIREGVQTNEMFHLWFLNNNDRNIYFEFLQPGLRYKGGPYWNGLENLQDRMLVYVNNNKTTLHFKVKGQGDTRAEAVKPIESNPVVTAVIKDGASVVDSSSYNALSDAVNNGTAYGSWNESQFEELFRQAGLNGKTGQSSMDQYFYGTDSNSHVMLYEGCGWWICNIGAAGNLTVTVDYDVAKKNETKTKEAQAADPNADPVYDHATYTISKTISSGLSGDTYLVVDPATGKVDTSTSEEQANYWIDNDTQSYTTIKLKSSNIGSIVAPYLDYHENNVSSTERRLLLEAIEASQKYTKEDYEESSYKVLSDYVEQGIQIYNSTANNAKANRDKIVEITKQINDAIKALKTKVCSSEIYNLFEEKVKVAMAIEADYNNNKNYDGSQMAEFLMVGSIYQRCKELYESKDILDKTVETGVREVVVDYDEEGNPITETVAVTEYVYNSTTVVNLTNELDNAITIITSYKFDKKELSDLINEAKTQSQAYYTKYPDENDRPDGMNDTLELLEYYITSAEGVYSNSTSKSEVETTINTLRGCLDELLAYSLTDYDTSLLQQYISDAETLLDKNVTLANYTDETYNALSTQLETAKSVKSNPTSQTEVNTAATDLYGKIEAFTVMKPENSIDALKSNNKFRIWVKGANKGTTIKGRTRDGNYENYDYTVTSFIISDPATGYTLSSSFGTVIENQNLTYFDVDSHINATGFKLQLNVEHNVYDYVNYNASTQTYPILSTDSYPFTSDTVVNFNDVTDGNFVIEVKDLSVKTLNDGDKGTPSEQLEFEKIGERVVKIEKQKLTEFFISGYSNAEVQVDTKVGESTVRQIYPTITEGSYQVARFIYAENQTAVVKGLDTENSANTFVMTDAINTSSGQRVVHFKGSDRSELQMLRLVIPYDVPALSGNSLTQFYVEANGNNYTAQFDGTRYIFEMNYTGETQIAVHRKHMVNGKEVDSVSDVTNYGSAGVFELVYSTTTAVKAKVLHFVGYEKSVVIDVEDIYPKYQAGSGSGSGSATSLNGIVSDKIVNSILGISDISTSASVPFDYFGQSGVAAKPTLNIGTTIIWIDTNNKYFKNKDLSTLRVYSWANKLSTGGETDVSKLTLTEEYPGTLAIRVADTNYYYLPVKSTAYGCILTAYDSTRGKRVKIGDATLTSEDNYESKYKWKGTDALHGNIYFDFTDLKHVYMDAAIVKNTRNVSEDYGYALNFTERAPTGWGGYRTSVVTKGPFKVGYDISKARYDSVTIIGEPGGSIYSGQGFSSLFQKIDEDVLGGKCIFTTKTWDKNRGTCDDQVDYYCDYAPGAVIKGNDLGNKYFAYREVTSTVTDSANHEITLTDINGNTKYTWGYYVTKAVPEGETDPHGDGYYHMYDNAQYFYRAKAMMEAPYYEYNEPTIDTSDMDATNLRMAFVGGTKIRLQNYSYYYSYGDLYAKGHSSLTSKRQNSSHSVNISTSNYFGGSGGNRESEGRIGDTDFSMVYDWYEYKIPVDKTNSFNVQFSSVRYNGTYVMGRPEQQWYFSGFKTDTQYTSQIKSAYGDIYVVMKDTTTVTDGKLSNMLVYTCNPETVQVKDVQDVYVRLPSGWTNLKIDAYGVGENVATYSEANGKLTQEFGFYKADIPATTPFLEISAYDSANHQFIAKTSIQSNDVKLFDPTYRAGTGGWDSYQTPTEEKEAALYAAYTVYCGYVLPKEYDRNGNAVAKPNGDSYDYPESLGNYILPCFTDGNVNATGYGKVVSDVNSYATAYKNLYAKLAAARAYLSPSASTKPEVSSKLKNFPEYLHSSAGDLSLWSRDSLSNLADTYIASRDVYTSPSSSLADINNAAANLTKKINDMVPDPSQYLPIIFYDAENLVAQNANFEIEYKDASGLVKREKVKLRNTENMPIYFVGDEEIYDVRFIVNSTEEGIAQDVIKRSQGAWVYMALPKKEGQTTAYWVQNSPADYRQINNTEYSKSNGDSAVFLMLEEGKSKPEGKASENDAQKTSYQPITLYFKNDVMVYISNTDSYKIRAGQYTFESSSISDMLIDTTLKDNVLTSTDANTYETDADKIPKCPFVYKNVSNVRVNNDTVSGWVPTLDLYTQVAKKYFSDPFSYFKYTAADDDAVDAETLANWVITSKDASGNITRRTINATGSGFTSSKTVNFTADNGKFASSKPWNYTAHDKLYFRWENNSALRVEDNVTFTANEIRFASAGKIDGTSNYNKHFAFKTLDGSTSMDVIFPTDLRITYTDQFKITHSFTIREGSYTVSKDPSDKNDYICDLFNEDYWTRMEFVDINYRYESLGGGYNGSGGSSNGRFTGALYSDITDDDV